ncbi:CRISPR-associated endonuclease Cas1 [Gallintestinimicrobium sp.]|uniref:CRISPR-associated endonuclease Cas1 n=1 Tax=Gallintestinimicrobium sp. TaxID=2981655 RepID=UPI003AF0EC55
MSYLYVCEQGATIGYEANRFQVKYKNDLLKSVPAETLEMIEVFGNIQMTTQCMTECLKKGVSVIHDNRMLAERAFYCYGIYPVEGIGVFRVPKNGDARNKKPPALRVETKRCTKKSPFRYNRVVQALL